MAKSGMSDDTSFCGTKPITLGIHDGFGVNGWSKSSMAAVRSEAAKCANVKQVVEALTSPDLDLLVVHDIFMSPTAQFADYALPVKQPTVSHHLRLLREAGLIDCEKQGLWAYYFVQREALTALRTRLGDGLAALG